MAAAVAATSAGSIIGTFTPSAGAITAPADRMVSTEPSRLVM